MTQQHAQIITEIYSELLRARGIHPAWPEDVIHASAIVAEEAGEAVRAALNHSYHGEDIELLRTELIQCAATCIRAIGGIDEMV